MVQNCLLNKKNLDFYLAWELVGINLIQGNNKENIYITLPLSCKEIQIRNFRIHLVSIISDLISARPVPSKHSDAKAEAPFLRIHKYSIKGIFHPLINFSR